MIKGDNFYRCALNENGTITKIYDAEKGKVYTCPYCGRQMIPKQGYVREWHFAHKGNSDNCSYESYLHKLAKMRIRESFLKSDQFLISFYANRICSVTDCPLGCPSPCRWKTLSEKFNLKNYYDKCEEEAVVGQYRADLLLIHNSGDINKHVLIEIWVNHKSTKEKVESGLKIIEINIESEADIDNIISTLTIQESDIVQNRWDESPEGKIRFYNFGKDKYEIPDDKYQKEKFRFWIDSKGWFRSDNVCDYNPIKCLTENPPEINNAIFLIQSKSPIDSDFAFCKLIESELGIRYCTMCQFYRDNYSVYGGKICILYKKMGTNKNPRLSNAMTCRSFKQRDYSDINSCQNCKIIVKK